MHKRSNNETPFYLDSALSPEQRAADLLPRMSLEEKVGQMMQLSRGRKDAAEVDEWVQRGVGSFLQTPLQEIIRLQKLAENSRLGIPILFAEDAIHGHCLYPGATIFPTQLGLSSAWNPELFERMARITALEMTATGMFWTFSPVLCMGRDWRWGRVDETCGEDGLLIADMAAAAVRGYQGDDLSAPGSVLACAKHFAGYAMSAGGRDAYETPLSRRALKSEFLPPFRRAAEAGCASFMAGYQANDGVPASADRWLLRETLCEEWGFDGITVTDWDNVGSLVHRQQVCADLRQAVKTALEAGNHMLMETPGFYEEAIALVRDGEVAEVLVDDACRRILLAKFRLGLFDAKRYPPDGALERVGCAAHQAVALEAARESVVLLENKNGTLPLGADMRRIAVVGPGADDVETLLGDWSFGSQQADNGMVTHPRENIVTVCDALKGRAGTEVAYARGCHAFDKSDRDIEAAVEAARGADVVVACVGDHVKNHGEASDRADLDLPGAQQELLEALHAVGTPLVVVLVASKPHTVPWVQEHADAVLTAFNPGMKGGQAIAEALFGDLNPQGKLTLSFPRHVGQQPVNYQQFSGWHAWFSEWNGYYDMPPSPLWPFGHGLSYTEYTYENLKLTETRLTSNDVLAVTVDVTNCGGRDGVEIVQLYINDRVSSVTTPVKQLRAYARVALAAGERRTVQLEVAVRDLALVLPDLSEAVEPGWFDVMVGPSSRNEDLLKTEFEVIAG